MIQVKKDTDGVVLLRGKCKVCKQCWIRLSSPGKGQCIYGGPFGGFVKHESKQQEEQQTAPQDPVPKV